MQPITPCLWVDRQAEAAAEFYVSVFPNSTIYQVLRYGEAGREQHGPSPGTVMTVEFELDGQRFTALNGGPQFRNGRLAVLRRLRQSFIRAACRTIQEQTQKRSEFIQREGTSL